MIKTNGSKILKELGYNNREISEILAFKFGFEIAPYAKNSFELGYEHAARLYRIFRKNSSSARRLYDFVDGHRRNLEKTVSSSEVVEELEENLEYWEEKLKKNFLSY